jgi:hypothetical protein
VRHSLGYWRRCRVESAELRQVTVGAVQPESRASGGLVEKVVPGHVAAVRAELVRFGDPRPEGLNDVAAEVVERSSGIGRGGLPGKGRT